jgi:hypothetical protein
MTPGPTRSPARSPRTPALCAIGTTTATTSSRSRTQSFARARKADAAELRSRFDRVLLQRAWKVCGTFARAVAQGRGEAYRRYLPGEIALVGRLLGDSPEEREFRRVFEARLG